MTQKFAYSWHRHFRQRLVAETETYPRQNPLTLELDMTRSTGRDGGCAR
jgi:hypothetical protein